MIQRRSESPRSDLTAGRKTRDMPSFCLERRYETRKSIDRFPGEHKSNKTEIAFLKPKVYQGSGGQRWWSSLYPPEEGCKIFEQFGDIANRPTLVSFYPWCQLAQFYRGCIILPPAFLHFHSVPSPIPRSLFLTNPNSTSPFSYQLDPCLLPILD